MQRPPAAALVLAGDCYFVGCTDSTRPNFDPTATQDSGLCQPIFVGCTASASLNYAAEYNADDGSCAIGGCTDPSDANYNSGATFADGTCSDTRRQLHRQLDAHSGCMAPTVRTLFS